MRNVMDGFVESIEGPGTIPGGRILVLNRNWQAVNVIGVRRTFSLLWQDHARVVNTYAADLAPMDAAEWLEFSQQVNPSDRYPFIRTIRRTILIPRVLLLREFDRLPVSEIKFNRENVFIRDNYTCQYSGKRCKPAELTLDHVIPRERGGRTSWENIVTCRRDLNTRKANRLPHEAGLVLMRKPFKPKLRPFAATINALQADAAWTHFLPIERSAG